MPRRPGSSPAAASCTATSPACWPRIDGLLAEHGLNIEEQLLSTTGGVGYVVTDVPGAVTPDVVEELRQMPETIRARRAAALPCR